MRHISELHIDMLLVADIGKTIFDDFSFCTPFILLCVFNSGKHLNLNFIIFHYVVIQVFVNIRSTVALTPTTHGRSRRAESSFE